eukprot:TRINITY_DN719_c0_g5_i3.p2 TRINITY_DN719_c0_g5~~TRINITY_DN719_c0_g5_i3.p2  ORF type:complete len:210 (-),score=43.10 TRINITY_DN719_c0_g5_i3:53-682(-)
MMCGNSNFIAAYTSANYLHLYNLCGVAVSEPLCIPNACFLECNQLFSLLALQTTGKLFLWNLSTRSLLLKTNVAQLFPRLNSDRIAKVFLDDLNNILLNTTLGKVFRYDFSFGVFKKAKDISIHSVRSTIDFSHFKPQSEFSRLLFSDTEEFKDNPQLDQRRMYQYDSNSLEEKLITAKALRLGEYWVLFRKYVLILVCLLYTSDAADE